MRKPVDVFFVFSFSNTNTIHFIVHPKTYNISWNDRHIKSVCYDGRKYIVKKNYKNKIQTFL